MPTLHVSPEQAGALQDIANALVKARKVVVVTGAGISTNSGIPDFRSENGLYSLIQAQFDAAAREAAREAAKDGSSSQGSSNTSSSQEPESESSATSVSEEFPEERPRKRQRISSPRKDGTDEGDASDVVMEDVVEVQGSPSNGSGKKGDIIYVMEERDTIYVRSRSLSPSTLSPRTDKEDTCSPNTIHVARSNSLPPELESQSQSGAEQSNCGSSPFRQRRGFQCSSPISHVKKRFPAVAGSRRQSSMSDSSTSVRSEIKVQPGSDDLPSSPPSRAMSSIVAHASSPLPARRKPLPDSRGPLRTPLNKPHLAQQPLSSSPLSDPPLLSSSSPLSSPPPNLFDPYQETEMRRDSNFGTSTTPSEADEIPPSSNPFAASQTGRNLPSMKGKDLFDASIWSCPIRTSVFYTFATSLRQKVRDANPTDSHFFIGHLRDRGKLVRCYTQNIDQIEEKVGLSTSLEQGPGNRSRFSLRRSTTGLSKSHSNLSQMEGRDNESGKGDVDQGSPVSKRFDPDTAVAIKNTNTQEEAGSGSQEPDAAASSAEGSQDGSQGSGSVVEKTAQDVSGKLERLGSDLAASQQEQQQQPQPQPQSQPQQQQRAPQASPSRGVECVFLHGSLQSLRCFLCGRICDWDGDGRQDETLLGGQPECPHCVGATVAREERGKRALGVGKLRPDIVLYGEEHPNADLISPIVTHDLGLGPDLLLILGTSLRVHGLKTMVREFAKAVHSKGGKVVFVNFTKPSESSWGDVIDYWVEWDCDAWVANLKERVPILWLPPGTKLEAPSKKKKRESTGERKKPCKSANPKKVEKAEKAGKTGSTVEDSLVLAQETQEPSPMEQNADAKTESKDKVPVAAPSEPLGPPEAPKPAKRPRKAPKPRQTPKPKPNPKPKTETETEAGAGAEKHNASDSKAREAHGAPKPVQRPQALREDKQNGAYLSRRIVEHVFRITGRPIPPLLKYPSAAACQVAAKAWAASKPKPKPKRKSAPAVLQRSEAALVGGPSQDVAVTTQQRQPIPIGLGISIPAPSTPVVARAVPEPASEAVYSVLAAVKSNPRKRKRKTIDGEEVAMPTVGRRKSAKKQVPPPLTLPFMDKENEAPAPALRSLYPRLKDGSFSVDIPPLKEYRSVSSPFPRPEPLEPTSSPTGPLAAVSPNLRQIKFEKRTANPFFLHDPLINSMNAGPVWASLKGPRKGWNAEQQLEAEAAIALSRLGSDV